MASNKPGTAPSSYFSQEMAKLNDAYGSLPMDNIYNAFMTAGGWTWLLNWPDIQNRRVKAIDTLPKEYTRENVAEMVVHPEGNELPLRQLSASLASSTKTYDLILQTYQDIMTYYWYVYPSFSLSGDKETALREYSLCCKLAETMSIKAKAHEIVGKCMQYGKVFYTPRISVDKAHNKINYAFLQQLPEDWCKIVGYNNGPGKYTVAFNLLYFMRPGTDWRQYGDLFRPYMPYFSEVVERDERYVYSSADPGYRVNVGKFRDLKISQTPGAPEWACVGQKWFYWVTLPAETVITFEIVDRNALVAPPTTGMMLSMLQIPNYEAAQLEIVLNPLTSVLTGSLDTYDPKGAQSSDPIRISNETRKIFEALWYQQLEKNNTSGIGIFLAPASDLKLQTLSDSVANTNITSTALADQIVKAGLPALIPTVTDPKVGVANLSAALQSQYALPVYWAIERMMNWIFDQLRLSTPMKFKMFGDIFSREKELKTARDGMTHGLLLETLRYNAMQGHTLLDDIAISSFIDKSGVLNNRKPLITSYSAKQETSGLPPQMAHEINPGGRPPEEGSISSEVTEKLDAILDTVSG